MDNTVESRHYITGDPELERLTSQVRASLLVDPAELRKSESVPTDTAMKASRIAQQMSAYIAGNQLAAVASETTTINRPERSRYGYDHSLVS